MKDEEIRKLFDKYEKCSERYIEAEKFLIEISEMKWWERIFITRKIYEFFKSRNKYEF